MSIRNWLIIYVSKVDCCIDLNILEVMSRFGARHRDGVNRAYELRARSGAELLWSISGQEDGHHGYGKVPMSYGVGCFGAKWKEIRVLAKSRDANPGRGFFDKNVN